MKGMAAAWYESPMRPESGKAVPVGQKLLIQLRPVTELGELGGRAAQRERAGRGIRLKIDLPASAEYRVALSQRAWIELIEEGGRGRVLGAATSDKRLACTGIAKNLGFDVPQPGLHVLQITEVPAEEVDVLVWPASGLTAGSQK
jgi:hypothetical protein